MSKIYNLKFLGSIASLSRLGRDIGVAGATRFLWGLSSDLGKEALSLVDEGFAKGVAPDGKRWPRPRKAHRALIESGALRSSWTMRSSALGVTVESSAPYAIFVQRGVKFHNGAQGMSARKMVPEDRLPLRWKERLAAVFQRNLMQLVRDSR